MDKKYIVLSRYEHWASNAGIEFTNWFVLSSTPRTKEEALDFISEKKKNFNAIDKITKLKHEFDIKPYEEYLNEYKKQQKTIEKLEQQQKKYYKSDEYKELQKKKRKAAKELKERQIKYAEEHSKE